MENKLISSYSDYGYEDYTIEDFYWYCVENDDEFKYSKEKFIEKFNDSNDFYEWSNNQWNEEYIYVFDEVCIDADYVLCKKSYVKVEGSMGLWNGRREVNQIIVEVNLKDIINKYLNPDMLEIEVYEDRVELINIHHDGRNSYTFTPFSFSDLTKKELLEQVDKEEYEWYGDKLYKATKDDLVNHLEDIFLKGY